MQSTAQQRECIHHCQECYRLCTELIDHCLRRGGEHAEAGHIKLLIDCAQICQTSADFMLRGSDLHTATCEACAEICARCADDCERFSGDEPMLQCAAACRSCAEACRNMSREGAAH
jgi:hypothetical protein